MFNNVHELSSPLVIVMKLFGGNLPDLGDKCCHI